jgi:predicted aspartyl protease
MRYLVTVSARCGDRIVLRARKMVPYRRSRGRLRFAQTETGLPMLGRATIASVLLAALAGCAGNNTTVCRTDIALENRQHLILGPVSVDGATVPGILDTGAQASAVTEGLVTRLGLLSDPRNGSVMTGVGGEGVGQNDALVNRFELAGFDAGSTHYPVVSLPVDSAGREPLGALVGVDLLGHFDIDLDVGHDKMVLYDPDRCTGAPPQWQADAIKVPMDMIWGSGRLLLTVKIDGQDVRALLDSGASASVLDRKAAARLGVTPAMMAQESKGEGFGAAGVNFQRTLHRFRSLEIAGERFDSPKLSVLDRDLHDADMLLGLDWLRNHHVLISFRRRLLLIERPTGVG